jgi:hypothetical protein
LRRVKAAGLDDEPCEDTPEFRAAFARRLAMFINHWHGCPEGICRRNRGCMAPNVVCSNLPPLTPEEIERDWPEVQARIYKAVQAEIARRGMG